MDSYRKKEERITGRDKTKDDISVQEERGKSVTKVAEGIIGIIMVAKNKGGNENHGKS